MKKILLLPLLLFITFILKGQDQINISKKDNVQIQYLGSWEPEWDHTTFYPTITTNFENNKGAEENALKEYKEEVNARKLARKRNGNGLNSQNKTTTAILPVVEKTFPALTTQGTPSDNTIAVNTLGDIVLAVNSNIAIADENGATTARVNLNNFFSNPSNGTLQSSFLCDPNIIFDPVNKRFIVVAITCSFNNPSQVLIAFSKTENPAAGWNFYTFSGSPTVIGNNAFFDYPKIGVSNSDLFISANFFDATGSSFLETGVYQFNKAPGYAGTAYGNNDATLHYSISGNPFTMAFATNGQLGGYGDKMYAVVSSYSSFASNKLLKLYEFTDKVVNNPQLNVFNLFAQNAIETPSDGVQDGSNIVLITGDKRAMDAIYVNGTIHFTCHVLGRNDYTEIFYSRLTNNGSAWTSNDMVIGVNDVDLAFPSLASFGYDQNDQSVLINMNYSSFNHYPGTACVFINHNGDISNVMEVVQGVGPATVLPTSNQTRWGDYTAASPILNATTPTAWVYGMAGGNQGRWANVAAKIKTGDGHVSIEDVQQDDAKMQVFPNPVIDVFSLKFETKREGVLTAGLYTIDGRVAEDLMTQAISKGEHEFSFNKADLSPGNYILRLQLDGQEVASSKLEVN